MVGRGVLLECLEETRVEKVLVVGRGSVGLSHPKLREIIHSNFFDFSPIQSQFAGYDGCFFALGVSAVGKTEAEYSRLTYDITMAAARAIHAVSPPLVFCYVSGAGTDSTERGRAMWARVKGRTENALLAMFEKAYMFRPGVIVPLKGVRSRTGWYQAFYSVFRPLLPILRRLAPNSVLTTVVVGRAFIAVLGGYPKRLLEVDDINALGKAG